MRKSNLKLAAVFLLSIVIISYELAVMRSFAVGSWSTFGSTVISIALLGFGLAGTFLTFVQKKVERNADRWLSYSALLLIPAMTLGHILAQQIDFNPLLIAVDPAQLWLIGAYYLVYSIPFICGAMFIGVAFIALSKQIHELYFWNMVGSGVGGFFILLCMYLFKTDQLLIPVLSLSFIGSLICFMDSNTGLASSTNKSFINKFIDSIAILFAVKLKQRFNYYAGKSCQKNKIFRHNSTEKLRYAIKPINMIICGLVFLCSLVAIIFLGKINVSEYKSVNVVRKFHEYKLDHYSYSPLGEIHLYDSSYFHSAPGLSDNAAEEVNMPARAFKGLYIDGGGPINVMRKLDKEEEDFIDYLPTSVPYQVLTKPNVLLIKLGGGTGAFTALHHQAEKVVVVEPNSDILKLMRSVPVITEFNGNLLNNPKLKVIQGEPRAYCSTTLNKYDLIEISLIDSVGLSQAGGYPVVENFNYTVEAILDYMKCLKQDGMLSITVWNKLSPPRNVPRLLSTVARALNMLDKANAANRVIVFNKLLQTATIIIKKTDFSSYDVEKIVDFCDHMSFELSYYPGMQTRNKDFTKILESYTKMYTEPKTIETLEGEEMGLLDLLAKTEEEQEDEEDLLPSDLYHFSLLWLFAGREQELFDKYIFDIRPATDDRPYYTAYLKPQTIGVFLLQIPSIAEDWGYLLLLATLIQSLLFGAIIIIIPLLGRWRELFKKKGRSWGIIIYYACLGLGYMLVEIFLIQRLNFFLEDPIFSVSVVICSMLVISGLGSLFSSCLHANRIIRIRMAVIGIALSLLFYIFGLSPLLGLFVGLPIIIKMILAVVFIAPAAFFMGMPFPTGLNALTENRKGLLPWAWGMNGALSVTGSVLARLFSVSFGFSLVLLGAIVLYILAGLFFPWNEGKGILTKR